ncbi:MAG: hypothetical protein U1E76_27075 [Planctomycetota bacterium]
MEFDYNRLVDLSIVTSGLMYLATCVAVPVLRRRRPNVERRSVLPGGVLGAGDRQRRGDRGHAAGRDQRVRERIEMIAVGVAAALVYRLVLRLGAASPAGPRDPVARATAAGRGDRALASRPPQARNGLGTELTGRPRSMPKALEALATPRSAEARLDPTDPVDNSYRID